MDRTVKIEKLRVRHNELITQIANLEFDILKPDIDVTEKYAKLSELEVSYLEKFTIEDQLKALARRRSIKLPTIKNPFARKE